ncbi:hypothetical protein [Sphingomonas crusticola]|uniref:hypothetical protein n=1 Tax=Sphingomonas crusticola TaxID=1697973 RepID=UPI000E26E27B|nr:hypothetical protein [Sphingomonas crusticola]
MTFFLLAGALVALSPAAPAPSAHSAGSFELAQLTFRSRVVVRVQTSTLSLPAVAAVREKKGPRCVPIEEILAAGVLARSSVDLVLRGGYRMRVRFSASCPGLDYYSGFYLVPSKDGKICADRDAIRDRAGGECAIDKFRRLVAAR